MGALGNVSLLARAALPALPGVNLLPGVRKTGSSELSGLASSTPPMEIRREHVSAYSAVCGFPVKDTVPVTYLHILGFPLHLRAMGDPRFPYPALGAVHVTNLITARRPVRTGETVVVSARVEQPEPHQRGHTVAFVTEVTVAGEPVWEGRSTYLYRGAGSAAASAGPVYDEVAPSAITWRLPSDLGRRYAAVSGDHNPIHLYPLTAKALGFKRQIAHGMWSAARCVAAIENRLPDAVTIDVGFRRPLYLPATVAFGVKQTDIGTAFVLADARTGGPHLQGRTERLP